MNLTSSLDRIRRVIRDNDKAVFSDNTIIRLWDEGQKKFASETLLLEKEVNLPVPAFVDFTYTQRWEDEYGGRASTLFYSFAHDFTFTQPWEPSVLVGATPSVEGGTTSTQSWESYVTGVQNRIPHFFPEDYVRYTYTAYDNEPIGSQVRRTLEEGNESFKTAFGLRPSLYTDDYESGIFFLYPKVTEEMGGKSINSDFGVLAYDPDDEINPSSSDYGVIVYSSEFDLSDDYGVVTTFQTGDDNLTLIYNRTPRTLTELADESDLPKWSHKYVEFYVLWRLFSSETDLQNINLSRHFQARYGGGVRACEVYKSNRYSMRWYRKRSDQGMLRKKKRRPDLPGAYPSYWR